METIKAVRLLLRTPEGLVLGVPAETPEGTFRIPGRVLEAKETPEDAVRKEMEALGLSPAGEPISVYAGPCGCCDKLEAVGMSAEWSGDLPLKESGYRTAPASGPQWVKRDVILAGPWWNFSRRFFNAAGILRRPPLTLDWVYRISNEAVHGDPDSVQDGVDAVLDEMSWLVELGHCDAVDALIKEVNVERVHGDVLSAFLAALEPEAPKLKEFVSFADRANKWIWELDSSVRQCRERYGR